MDLDHVCWNIFKPHRVDRFVARSPEEVPGSHTQLILLIGYVLFFYLAWTFVWVYEVYPWANKTIGATTFAYAPVNVVFRLLIWVLPVCLYLRYVNHVDVLDYLQMKQYWRG